MKSFKKPPRNPIKFNLQRSRIRQLLHFIHIQAIPPGHPPSSSFRATVLYLHCQFQRGWIDAGDGQDSDLRGLASRGRVLHELGQPIERKTVDKSCK